jgi:hypothetical protein
MKRILPTLLTTISLSALGHKEPPPFDADLFKKDDQICSVHAELLFWTLAEGNLDYALKMREPAPISTYAQGSYQTAGYDFDPGFRLAFLYFRAPHYWEVKWQYTRMTCSGHNSALKSDVQSNYLTGTWPQIIANPLSKAESHIHFNYNLFDMTVDRVFVPNPHLRLRTILGPLFTWMSQDWKVRYIDAIPDSTTIRNKWDFIGAGMKGAMLVDWYWTGELYMTAGGSLGIAIGAYDNYAKQTATTQTLPVRDTKYHDVRSTVMAQMILGPSWQHNYPKNRVELFAGFEMNVWSNLQEIYRSTSGTPSQAKETWVNASLLAFYGLSMRATVDF